MRQIVRQVETGREIGEYMRYYTLQELCSESGVSRATFYRLQTEDLDFMVLAEEHSVTGKRGARKYDQVVLDCLLQRIGQQDPSVPASSPAPDDSAPPAPDPDPQPDYHSLYIDALRDENARLRAELELRAAEAAELRTQNAQLLMLLAAEKSEKQGLLAAASEPPRQRSWFGRNKKT